ncbi:hypothetical protein O181_080987 [Austropuccinia psidii MF-1]|uniref:Uncharacterized protein n=1 Tax=Austropuccinia psidii MF-1 TaxID=1389203 RepID=A0A9Q3IHY7_9BASI|nr:hypothetical protein [Austropuccinia psidii MF-1]
MYRFLKQKERLTELHYGISETMVHRKILRKCGGDLENSLISRCIEPFSKEDYINAMEDMNTRKSIGGRWYKPQIDNKTNGKTISRERPNKPQDRAPLKCQKCRKTPHLANTCPNKTRINEIPIEKPQHTR